MKHPSRSWFRLLTVAALTLDIVYSVTFEFQLFGGSRSIREALDLNYHGALMPFEVLRVWWWFRLVVSLIGYLAFLLFLPWSRGLLAGVIAMDVVLRPFQGLYVATGLYDAIGYVASICLFVPLVLSFFGPCDTYFGASPPNLGLERTGDPATGSPGAQPSR